MSTRVAFQPPAGNTLRLFNRTIPASQQSSVIPNVFCDSMSVREAVFVIEMGAVPLVHHTDTDDARSYHWVIYAPESSDTLLKNEPRPIGTIRLVPYPHHSHPQPGAHLEAPGPDAPSLGSEEVFLAPPPSYTIDRRTRLHDGEELYLKLGRLCVVKEFRGQKLADLLIKTALEWAAEHPEFPGIDGIDGKRWKGLVCIHAQEKAATMWQRNGFVIDEELGTWYEAGIMHYGMFCRVDLQHK